MKYKLHLTTLLILLLSLPKTSKADLYLIGLSLKLECLQPVFCKDDIVQFNLTLTNATEKSHSILIPGSQNKGHKLIHFSFFSVKDNFYTEVYHESERIDMNNEKPGSTTFDRLAPKESTIVPLFLNDKVNYKKHIEANHPMPDLPPGKYEVLVWYSPWEDSMSKYVYHMVSDFKTERTFDAEKINLPEGRLNSNYVTVTITDKKGKPGKSGPSTFCPDNCDYCLAIEKGNWDKVSGIIDRQTYYTKATKSKTDTSWAQPHRNVAWLSPGPDAVLSSLPSWYGRTIIFKNSKGYHYYSMTWQIGKIYHTRSRIRMFGNMTRLNLPIKTEDLDYFRLVSFFPY